MTTPDVINAAFEGIGSVMIWLNVYKIYKDKGYAGMSMATVIFMTAWGVYNLYYYPHLGQWISFFAGCSMAIANCAWLFFILKFGHNTNEEHNTNSLGKAIRST